MTYKKAIEEMAIIASKTLHRFDSPSFHTNGYGMVLTLATVYEKEFDEVRKDFYKEYKKKLL